MEAEKTMKFALLSLFAVAVLAGGCSTVKTLDLEGVRTVNLHEVNQNPKVVFEALSDEGKGLILKIDKHEWIPLHMDVQGPFATLESGTNRVRFTRDVLLYLNTRELLISPDGERWGALHDPGALKDLFDFEQGSMRIGFGVTEKEGALLSFGLRTE